MHDWLSLLSIISSIASLVSFIGGLLFAAPEKRRVVIILALAFATATVIAVGAALLATPQNRQGPTASVPTQTVDVWNHVPFPPKFAGLTFGFVGTLCVIYWAFTQIQAKPLSLQQAAVSVWGSHIARLRTLLLVAIVCFILAAIYPGPPLIPASSFDWLRNGLHKIWDGTPANPQSSPPAPDGETWFWGQAALLYLGCFTIYFVFAFPHEIVVAWEEASRVAGEDASTSGSTQKDRSAEVFRTFISSLLRQLKALNRS